MRTFYFNTGVRPENNPNLFGNQVWRGGTKQIPFTCDIDESSRVKFLFACDNPNLEESKSENVIVKEIQEPNGLLSKYAYFLVLEQVYL
ncbi:MAG: hypothetical protein JETCAE03_35080 [Ignavibacteriaceae bacterium]|nr:MAG: hypothetical protein JETCAE03_35080 [Ignavibacteriaceae bacterium]